MQITRYDETLVDARAVNLTNSIGTVDIDVPVGFSCPTGAFRLSEPNNITFTHFTADVPSLGGERVFKITSLTCINSKVTEYYYDIDYLKDYWFRYSEDSVSGPYIPLPQTLLVSQCPEPNGSSGSIFPVNQHLSSFVDTIAETTGNEMRVSKVFLVMMSARGGDTTLGTGRIALKNSSNEAISPKAVYLINDASLLDAFYTKVLEVARDGSGNVEPWDDGTFSGFYSNINNAFFAPCTLANTGASTNYDDVVYYLGNDGSSRSKTFAGTELHGAIAYINFPTSNGIIENVVDTGLTITLNSANDLPPYKKYQIYIPYVGWYDIPINEIYTQDILYSNHKIYVKYYYDLINGKVSCRFGMGISAGGVDTQKWSNYQTPYTPLPSLAVPTSNYATNAIMAENQKETATMSNTISSLLGIGVGIATGNPLAVGGALVGGFTKQINTELSYQQQQANNSLGGFTSGRDSSIGQIDRQFKLRIITFYCSLSYNEAIDLYGYTLNQYTNSVTFDSHAGVDPKAWLDVSNARFKGPEWYTTRVRDEFNRDYVTYAVTTP